MVSRCRQEGSERNKFIYFTMIREQLNNSETYEPEYTYDRDKILLD